MSAIFITGQTATGKTWYGKRLAEQLGYEYLSTDSLYDTIKRKYYSAYPVPSQNLTHPYFWDSESDIKNYRLLEYDRVLDPSKNYVIEGATLAKESERRMIEDLLELGGQIPLLHLDPQLSEWNVMFEKKHHFYPSPDIRERFLLQMDVPSVYYQIRDLSMVLVTTGKYQRNGFTDKKWEKLNLGDLSGKTVLDLGCNDGMIGEFALSSGASRVLGMDNNWMALERSRGRGLKVRLVDFNEDWTPYSASDVVLCLATAHYVKDKHKFFSRVRAATKEVFVLEIPIWKEGVGLTTTRHERPAYDVPTNDLVMSWLQKYFARIDECGESVSPDRSYRLIFKAYVNE